MWGRRVLPPAGEGQGGIGSPRGRTDPGPNLSYEGASGRPPPRPLRRLRTVCQLPVSLRKVPQVHQPHPTTGWLISVNGGAGTPKLRCLVVLVECVREHLAHVDGADRNTARAQSNRDPGRTRPVSRLLPRSCGAIPPGLAPPGHGRRPV